MIWIKESTVNFESARRRTRHNCHPTTLRLIDPDQAHGIGMHPKPISAKAQNARPLSSHRQLRFLCTGARLRLQINACTRQPSSTCREPDHRPCHHWSRSMHVSTRLRASGPALGSSGVRHRRPACPQGQAGHPKHPSYPRRRTAGAAAAPA